MISAIRERIERKFDAATLDMSPFPHLVIEEFFPEDVYAKIMAYNPFKANRGEEWLSKSRSADVTSRTPYHARKQINFHNDQPFDAPDEERQFWDDLTKCFLGDDWFPSLVLHKFPTYFELRFGDLVKEGDFYSMFRRELFLQRHEPGYYIGPHTDIPTRVYTCIFSFAERPGFEEYGTELLSHHDRLVRCWGNDHYAPDDFTVTKLAPYKPNNFLLFFKTRQSFHSVKAIPDTVPNQRYGMQFQFYEPKGGIMHDLSVPDLMEVKLPHARPKGVVAKLIRSVAGERV
jgi:hypothetical protein